MGTIAIKSLDRSRVAVAIVSRTNGELNRRLELRLPIMVMLEPKIEYTDPGCGGRLASVTSGLSTT